MMHRLIATPGRESLARQPQFADLLRKARARLGLTQEKLAARLGVTVPTVNRWENGRATPSPLARQRVGELLREMGKDGADLLDGLATAARGSRA